VSAAQRRSRLLVVWLLLAVLVAVIVVLEQTDLVRRRTGLASIVDPRLLLPLPVDQLGAIEVANAGRLHRFERDVAGAWFYHGAHGGSEVAHTHTADLAAAQRIGHALAGFGRTRIERHLAVGRDVTEYGLTPPQILVLVYRPGESQPLAQYAVGDIAPDTTSRYVQIIGRPEVVTIPNYQIDNLLALIQAVERAAGPDPPAGSPATPGPASAGAQTSSGLATPGPRPREPR